MQVSRFYELIEEARGSADPAAPSADPEELRTVLDDHSDEDLAGFAEVLDAELVRLNRWDLWGAGYVLADGMSDDSFHYFRTWIVGKGRDAVERAIADPDSLVEILVDDDVESAYDNELLDYVVDEILEERNVDPPDIDLHADDDPEGEPFDEETVEAAYPRCAAFATAHPL